AETVAHVGVALDDDRGAHHQRGLDEPRRDQLHDGRHRLVLRRSSAATPVMATVRTVISTIVSRPRKSARMTVTTSAPWASGVRRICSAASLPGSGGRERAAQMTANALAPAMRPTTRLRTTT